MRKMLTLLTAIIALGTLSGCLVVPSNYGYGGYYNAPVYREPVPWCWSIGCTFNGNGGVRFPSGDGHHREGHRWN